MMRNFMKTVSLVAVLFAAVCNAQVHKPAYDGWSLLAPLPATNSETAVAELDGKIYVIGGYPADRKTVATVQMYDSANDKWQIVAPLPVTPVAWTPEIVGGVVSGPVEKTTSTQ